jgi:Fe-S-cluster containining protein
MDKRTENILENCEKNRLGLDDTVRFTCRTCGKCCKNRDDIMLTARDLYNIARSLSRTIKYVIERYCEVYIGRDSRMPIVRLRPGGYGKVCPLLRDGKCIVHDAKPVVCALFPLGRAASVRRTDDIAEKPEEFQSVYFMQPVTCGTKDHSHTVRSWLDMFGIPAEDEFYNIWTETIVFISDFFRSIEARKATEKTLMPLWDIAFSELYAAYDTEKELLPQFRENAAKLRVGFAEIDDLFAGGRFHGK